MLISNKLPTSIQSKINVIITPTILNSLVGGIDEVNTIKLGKKTITCNNRKTGSRSIENRFDTLAIKNEDDIQQKKSDVLSKLAKASVPVYPKYSGKSIRLPQIIHVTL